MLVVYKRREDMRRAFGEEENFGLLFKNMQEGARDNPFAQAHSSVPLRPSNSAHFAALNSIQATPGGHATSLRVPTGALGAVEFKKLYYWSTERLLVWQRRLEGFSCLLSSFCLIAAVGVWAARGSVNIELTRNVAFASRESAFTEKMRLWHTAVAESCAAGSFDLILTQPPWENDEKQKYDGFSMEGVIHNASHIDLTAVAFFVYLFSAVFQGARCWFFETKFQPNGPEFSRWLEYAFTSPLQVLLVALTFGVSNIDILLGYFGMQLALVVMGYSIEQQIRKTYVRETASAKAVAKFYWMPWLGWPFGPDIRGPVYLLVSWTLHILIWGFPAPWEAEITRWGLVGQYAYIHRYQTRCGDPKFSMPVFVDVIFWGQFICFLLFGLVCTVQFLGASFLGSTAESKDAIKGGDVYKKQWAKYSMAYAILSVTAKTLLEVGFLGLLISSPDFLKSKPLPKTAVQTYANVTQISVLDSNRPISVSPDTTCFRLPPAAK